MCCMEEVGKNIVIVVVFLCVFERRGFFVIYIVGV